MAPRPRVLLGRRKVVSRRSISRSIRPVLREGEQHRHLAYPVRPAAPCAARVAPQPSYDPSLHCNRRSTTQRASWSARPECGVPYGSRCRSLAGVRLPRARACSAGRRSARAAIASPESFGNDWPSTTSVRSGVNSASARWVGSSSSHALTAPARLVTSARSLSPRGTFSSDALIRQSISREMAPSPEFAPVKSATPA